MGYFVDELRTEQLQWYKNAYGQLVATFAKPKDFIGGYSQIIIPELPFKNDFGTIAMQNKKDESWVIGNGYKNDFVIEEFADCTVITTKNKDVIRKKVSIVYRYDTEYEDSRFTN